MGTDGGDGNRELECKLRIASRAEAAERLRELGAEDGGDALERNWVYDTEEGRFRRERRLLRVREYAGSACVTCKGPPEESSFKTREELECAVGSAGTMRRILERLGFRQSWYYEKKRHVWRYGNCEIVLDECPGMGAFLEIEGESAGAIGAVLGKLGHSPEEHIQASYLALFADHCASRGTAFCDMRFSNGGET